MSALPLTRERILDAALEWVDAEGLEALSMRKLAQVLGVKAMSLYNHVANKDEIIDALVDRVIGEMALPDPALDWKAAMRRRAISAHEVLLRHPWATMPIVSRMNVGPAMLRYVDATLGCLLRAGFSAEMADHAWNAIDSHIYGFTLLELNFPIAATEYVSMAKQFIHRIPPDQYPHMHHLTRLIIQGDYDGLHHFEFGLELILNGLEQALTLRSPG
ncbi:MAG: TetR/AcrR family transcriptional regulator C-terminal domain-containing protein [Cyanobacteriota bacterium]